MTKTEKLRVEIAMIVSPFAFVEGFGDPKLALDKATRILKLCADSGLGWKKELELPKLILIILKETEHDEANFNSGCVAGYGHAQEDMLNTGYTGFEPLEVKE